MRRSRRYGLVGGCVTGDKSPRFQMPMMFQLALCLLHKDVHSLLTIWRHHACLPATTLPAITIVVRDSNPLQPESQIKLFWSWGFVTAVGNELSALSWEGLELQPGACLMESEPPRCLAHSRDWHLVAWPGCGLEVLSVS